jgi:hypothetical protein
MKKISQSKTHNNADRDGSFIPYSIFNSDTS